VPYAVIEFDDAVRSQRGVLIFSKTTCAYCARVKKAFEAKGVPYAVIEFDSFDDDVVEPLRGELQRLSGISTVPVIFISGQLIGDSSTTIRKLSQGELDDLLKKAAL